MGKRFIVINALMSAVMFGGVHLAGAVSDSAVSSQAREAVTNQESGAAMEEYKRLLADYRKDLTAYEADPGTWTVEIPRPPTRPGSTAAAARQPQSPRQ